MTVVKPFEFLNHR